jgi:DNA-binding NtrC family response regulator
MEMMMHHAWPGNVRELIHRIERAVIMSMGHQLNENDLGLTHIKTEKPTTLKDLKENLEKESTTQALVRNYWNITHTSKELGITPKTLRTLIKRYSITKPY